MKNAAVRLTIAAFVFVAFTWGSTMYYGKFIHDVGATYWFMGKFSLPVALLLVWCADFYLKKTNIFIARPGWLTVMDSSLIVALYIPGVALVWAVIDLLGIA